MVKRKREKYIHKWLKEHPQVRLYLKKDEYEWLKELADKRKTSIKEIVLEAIKNAKKFYDEGYSKGFNDGVLTDVDDFIFNPSVYCEDAIERAKKLGLNDFEPCLFTAPCSICGEPMIFTHKDTNWTSEVRPRLLNAFKDWYHTKCEET